MTGNLEFTFNEDLKHRNPDWIPDSFQVGKDNWDRWMKEKIVKQYMCEFCGKKRYRRHIMAQHEKRCTANPDRKCGMCKSKNCRIREIVLIVKTTARLAGREVPDSPVLEFNTVNGLPTKSETLKQIEYEAHHCPACILAVHRAGEFFTEFDFKKASEAWWNEQNRTEIE